MGSVVGLALALICLGMGVYPLYNALKFTPLLAESPVLTPGSAAQGEARYRRFRLIGIFLFTIGPLLVGALLTLTVLLDDPSQPSQGALEVCLPALLAYFVLGTVIAQGAVALKTRGLAVQHPEFRECAPKLRTLLIGNMVYFALLIMAAAMTVFKAIAVPLCAGALLLIFLQTRLSKKEMARSQYRLPMDSPLGVEVSRVLTTMGIQPKQIVRFPLLHCNAFAFPDGSVLLTSTLLALLSEREVAAVVAHELSHVRDKEGGRYRWLTIMVVVPPIVLCGLAAFGGTYLSNSEALFLISVCVAPIIALPFAWIRARLQWPSEFKADQDAARIGYGEEMASALEKITRYAGLPDRWEGRDRLVMTHPELAERVARLRQPDSGQSEVTR